MNFHANNTYILMNKDVEMLEFHCQRDEFGEPQFIEDHWLTELRPFGYINMAAFLEGRKAPSHRRHIAELLSRYGCGDMEGFLQVTHALSLNDTFWVKEANSYVMWRDVSLYSNPFNEVISYAAFDGVFSKLINSSTSPEFSTDGYYAKCWKREPDGIYLYKAGSELYGMEPLSEYLSAQLSGKLCKDYVLYDMDFFHGKLISKCPLFTSEVSGLAKAGAVLREWPRYLSKVLSYFSQIGCEDAFRRMMILDAVILNPDRHFGNFGILFDADTLEIQGMAPVYDLNRALFPELDDDQLANPDWYIRKCTPMLGPDFITSAKGLLTDKIRQDLEQLRDFSFHPHPEIHADPSRLDALSRIVRRQIQAILS